MKLLKCKLCRGEMEIIGNVRAINKKVKCKNCKYTNQSKHAHTHREPEIVVIHKRTEE